MKKYIIMAAALFGGALSSLSFDTDFWIMAWGKYMQLDKGPRIAIFGFAYFMIGFLCMTACYKFGPQDINENPAPAALFVWPIMLVFGVIVGFVWCSVSFAKFLAGVK